LQLQNFMAHRWQPGTGTGSALIDATLGIELARATSDGLDLAAALDFARRTGGHPRQVP